MKPFSFVVEAGERGQRLDQLLHQRMPEYSRARLQDWIKHGRVQVDGGSQKASYAVRGGESVVVEPEALPPLKAEPEDAPLDILYEDADVVAINKPAGLVVHAGAGNLTGTLVNRLVHHFQTLSSVGGDERPGIVHRLDRETSGVLLVARTDAAHQSLAAQFSSRTVEKIYLTVVQGSMKTDQGRIEKPIARDPVRRTRMTTRDPEGRRALTDWFVIGRYGKYSYLRVKIGTGRTHQIRVHLSSIGHPVVGDTLYGATSEVLERNFLHAHRIAFDSPTTGARIVVESPLPPELTEWLAAIMKKSSQHP